MENQVTTLSIAASTLFGQMPIDRRRPPDGPDMGVSRNWWDLAGIDMTGQEMLTWGSSMRWVLRLIETGMPSGVAGVDVMEISRPDGASNIADLGLTLSEAKQLLARVQQAIVAAQAGDLAARRPECPSCRGRCCDSGFSA